MFINSLNKSAARFTALALVIGTLFTVAGPALTSFVMASGDPGACTANQFQGTLHADGTASVKNISNETCTAGLAVFLAPPGGNLDDQVLYDLDYPHDVRPGETIQLQVANPRNDDACEYVYQLDLFAGNFPGSAHFSQNHLIKTLIRPCNVTPAGPSADIIANGSDGPITIPSGTAATITWTSQNTTACTVSPTGWTGTSGSQSSGNLTSSRTYTLNCTGTNGQNVSDSVTVNVQNQCVAPVVTTAAAVNVTQNSATLRGTVDPNGQASLAWFEYGTTQSLGSQTNPETISGNNPLTISHQITNLQPNTTYYFRLVAQNQCGGNNVNGQLLTLTTGNPQVPSADIKANGSDGPITIAYNTSAQITWTSQNTTACTVSPTGWTGTSGSQSSGNLTASQTYTLNCTGTNGQNVSDSVTVNVQNQCVAPTVTTLSATNVTQNSAVINGTVNANGQNTTVWFEYGTSQSNTTIIGTQTVSGSGQQNVSATLTNLQPNTTYYFRLVATSQCGGGNINGQFLTFFTGGGNAPTADIKANGQDGVVTVQYNTAAQITWTSTNANSCTVSPTGWTGTSGSQSSGNIVGTIVYTLTCIGTNGQTAIDSVTVQPSGVNNQLPTVVLTANPTVITQGQSSVLSWTSTNATFCYASAGPWSGNKALSGSETVTPPQTSTYTITCTNSFGSASDTETVFVNPTGGTTIQVTKLVRNLTLNQTVFSQNAEAQGLDNLEFEIRVRNTESTSRQITVRDILPQELFYVSGSTTVNGQTAPDGIVTNGLDLGFLAPNEEKVVRFRAVVFYGTSERTITNQATATGVNGGFGNAYATVNIRNRGTVLGAADVVTGPGSSLMIAVIIGLLFAIGVHVIGKKRGWFVIAARRVETAKRNIEDVLLDLSKKAREDYAASHGGHF